MLTVEQKIELSHLEKTIERGKTACIEMALALLKIREEQLYRENHSTFEDYCQRRWEFSDRYGRMLVEYGETVRDIRSAGGTMVPVSERQSRALNGLKTEQKVEALAGAATIAPDNKPTAHHVQRAAAAVKDKPKAPFQTGTIATVLDEKSPYYRQQVEVVKAENLVVQAKTQSGETAGFLVNELTTGDSKPSAPSTEKAWAQKPSKPNHFESLELENTLLKQRCELLEGKLSEAVTLLQQSPSSPRLRNFLAEAQSLLA